METVTSGLPTMLRMRNLGSADKVTVSVREFPNGDCYFAKFFRCPKVTRLLREFPNGDCYFRRIFSMS